MATAGARYEERTGNIWSYAHRGDLTGLKAALARGVDVDMANTVGWTPAHAAAAGGQTKVLRLLARNGADLEVADRGGDLPAHQAAKNGHVHALQVLQELGVDITKVRLSQAKGKAVRDELIKAYQKAGRKTKGTEGGAGDEDGMESEEEEVAVGYARKQAKSTAFWGPRRQPISAKIKKKIIKEKRLKKREKLERKWGNNLQEEEDANDTADGSSNDPTEDVGPHEKAVPEEDATLQQEASYIETVRNIKRNKKNRRRQQQMRRQQQKLAEEEEPVHASSDEDSGKKDIQAECDSGDTSSEDEENRTNDASRAAVNGFAALSLMESSDSEDE